jgi:ribosome-binding protein aMBF1 (putative translation factor)
MPSVAESPSIRAHDSIESLHHDTNSYHLDDDAGFSALLKRAQYQFGMSDADLADEFLVSRPTVNRWVNGRNLPHRVMRKPIIEWIAAEAARRLRLRNRRTTALGARERV